MIYITYAHKPEIGRLKELTEEAGLPCMYVHTPSHRAAETLAAALADGARSPLTGASCVINAGFAGALDPGLKPGDVVLAGRFALPNATAQDVAAEYDSALLSDRRGAGPRNRRPHSSAVPRIQEAARRYCQTKDVRVVSCLTVDEPVQQAGMRNNLWKKTHANIVDMESFHLCQVTEEQRLPFLSMKIVSDRADESARESAMGQAGKWSKELGRQVHDLISHMYQ